MGTHHVIDTHEHQGKGESIVQDETNQQTKVFTSTFYIYLFTLLHLIYILIYLYMS